MMSSDLSSAMRNTYRSHLDHYGFDLAGEVNSSNLHMQLLNFRNSSILQDQASGQVPSNNIRGI